MVSGISVYSMWERRLSILSSSGNIESEPSLKETAMTVMDRIRPQRRRDPNDHTVIK